MADIKKELNDIKNAVYGREVRSSIHDGIKKINEESEESRQKAEEAYEITQDLLDETFDSAALEANFEQRLNDEIANLQPEWTEFKNDVTTQLAHTVNVLMFGAKGDGITDDTIAIQEAYNSLEERQTLVIPNGDFLVNGLVFDKNFVNIDCRGRLIQPSNETGTCVTINANDINIFGELRVERNSLGHNSETVGVHIKNSNRCNLHITVRRFKTGILMEGSEGKGTAYNTIFLKNIQDNKISIDFSVPDDSNPSLGWVNENKFFGGRFGWSIDVFDAIEGETPQESFDRTGAIHINLDGRHLNNNVFFSPSLEGRGGKFIYCTGQYNTFYSPRFEGNNSIFVHWDTGSIYNQVLFPYHHTEIERNVNYLTNGSRNKIFGRNFNLWEDTSTTGAQFKAYGDPRRSTHYIDGEGMFDARPTFANQEKLYRGRDVNDNETFYVTANGHMEVNRILIQDWRDIDLATGWTAPSPGQPPQYYRNKFGEVTLAGEIRGTGGHNTLLFTLPVGYRPYRNTKIATVARTGAIGSLETVLLNISTTGEVTLAYSEVDNKIIELGGISFRAIF